MLDEGQTSAEGPRCDEAATHLPPAPRVHLFTMSGPSEGRVSRLGGDHLSFEQSHEQAIVSGIGDPGASVEQRDQMQPNQPEGRAPVMGGLEGEGLLLDGVAEAQPCGGST